MKRPNNTLQFVVCGLLLCGGSSLRAESQNATRLPKPRIRLSNGQVVYNPVPESRGWVNPHVTSSGQGNGEVTLRTRRDGTTRVHGGLDIPAPVGTAVRAPVSGTVIYSVTDRPTGRGPAAGNFVLIRDENNIDHRFYHLEGTNQPSAGQHVTAGDTIGNVGRTGNLPANAASHLHYEVRDYQLRDANHPQGRVISLQSDRVSDDVEGGFVNYLRSLPPNAPRQFDRVIEHNFPSEPASASVGAQAAGPAIQPVNQRPQPAPVAPVRETTPQRPHPEQQLQPRPQPPQNTVPAQEPSSPLSRIGNAIGELIFGANAYGASRQEAVATSPYGGAQQDHGGSPQSQSQSTASTAGQSIGGQTASPSGGIRVPQQPDRFGRRHQNTLDEPLDGRIPSTLVEGDVAERLIPSQGPVGGHAIPGEGQSSGSSTTSDFDHGAVIDMTPGANANSDYDPQGNTGQNPANLQGGSQSADPGIAGNHPADPNAESAGQTTQPGQYTDMLGGEPIPSDANGQPLNAGEGATANNAEDIATQTSSGNEVADDGSDRTVNPAATNTTGDIPDRQSTTDEYYGGEEVSSEDVNRVAAESAQEVDRLFQERLNEIDQQPTDNDLGGVEPESESPSSTIQEADIENRSPLERLLDPVRQQQDDGAGEVRSGREAQDNDFVAPTDGVDGSAADDGQEASPANRPIEPGTIQRIGGPDGYRYYDSNGNRISDPYQSRPQRRPTAPPQNRRQNSGGNNNTSNLMRNYNRIVSNSNRLTQQIRNNRNNSSSQPERPVTIHNPYTGQSYAGGRQQSSDTSNRPRRSHLTGEYLDGSQNVSANVGRITFDDNAPRRSPSAVSTSNRTNSARTNSANSSNRQPAATVAAASRSNYVSSSGGNWQRLGQSTNSTRIANRTTPTMAQRLQNYGQNTSTTSQAGTDPLQPANSNRQPTSTFANRLQAFGQPQNSSRLNRAPAAARTQLPTALANRNSSTRSTFTTATPRSSSRPTIESRLSGRGSTGNTATSRLSLPSVNRRSRGTRSRTASLRFDN